MPSQELKDYLLNEYKEHQKLLLYYHPRSNSPLYKDMEQYEFGARQAIGQVLVDLRLMTKNELLAYLEWLNDNITKEGQGIS